MNEPLETKNIYESEPAGLTPWILIRKLLLNNKFLCVVIAQAVALLTSVIGIFTLRISLSEIISEFIMLAGENLTEEAAATLAQIQSMAGVIDSIFIGAMIIGLLPTIIVAVGCLLLYMGAKKDDPSTACNGALLFRILFTYHTVVCSLGIAFVVLCVVALCAQMAELAVLGVILGIVIIVPLIIANTYYSKFAKMFKNLGKAIRTDINVLKVYSLVTVINWISAICGLISAAGSFDIGSILSSISLILITTMFNEYKDEMGDPTPENIEAAKSVK